MPLIQQGSDGKVDQAAVAQVEDLSNPKVGNYIPLLKGDVQDDVQIETRQNCTDISKFDQDLNRLSNDAESLYEFEKLASSEEKSVFSDANFTKKIRKTLETCELLIGKLKNGQDTEHSTKTLSTLIIRLDEDMNSPLKECKTCINKLYYLTYFLLGEDNPSYFSDTTVKTQVTNIQSTIEQLGQTQLGCRRIEALKSALYALQSCSTNSLDGLECSYSELDSFYKFMEVCTIDLVISLNRHKSMLIEHCQACIKQDTRRNKKRQLNDIKDKLKALIDKLEGITLRIDEIKDLKFQTDQRKELVIVFYNIAEVVELENYITENLVKCAPTSRELTEYVFTHLANLSKESEDSDEFQSRKGKETSGRLKRILEERKSKREIEAMVESEFNKFGSNS